jgi:outer membrane protein OmpA-like peptidoglycan-associated protein
MMREFRLGAAIVAVSLALAPVAWAQSNPSANQIINSLRPSAKALDGSTRGIRPVSPQAAIPQEATAASVSEGAAIGAHPRAPAAIRRSVAGQPRRPTSAAAEAPSVNLFVQFANGSAELTPEATRALDELGKALSSNDLASYHFRIEGHTDTIGTKGYNQSLSERRAAAVADYLASHFGVSQTRLVTVGVGSDHLLVPTPDQTPEPRNRRVQVVNIGA